MINNIPYPVTFNCYKHHLGFLKNKIEEWKKFDWQATEVQVSKIGTNLIDLYMGELQPSAIAQQCLDQLENQGIQTSRELSIWLMPSGYRKLEISDQSEWVIRKGNSAIRFVHIHPAKHSLHTTRVRASTLKTVVTAMVNLNVTGRFPHLQEINAVRLRHLHLSPVKSLEAGKGILAIWELFNLP